MFKEVDRTYIEKLVYSFRKGRANCGDILVDYDSIPNYIYFLRSGTIKVMTIIISDIQ